MSKIICVYGGTFSPPHKGHINAAKEFVQAVKPEKLFIIPSYIPPHKEVLHPVSCEDRVEMCRIAFAEIENAQICEMEITRKGKSYTVDTLRALQDEYQGYQIAFLVGTDMMLTLDEWYLPDEIFALADIYCIRREMDTHLEAEIQKKNQIYYEKYGKRVHLLPSPTLEVSSSEIRACIAKGENSDFLTLGVRAYIDERGLYR